MMQVQVKEFQRAPDMKDFLQQGGNIFQSILDLIVNLPIVILPLIILYGGIMYMLAGDNDEKVAQAKNIIKWGIIGFVVYMASYAIVKLILNLFGIQADPTKLTI